MSKELESIIRIIDQDIRWHEKQKAPKGIDISSFLIGMKQAKSIIKQVYGASLTGKGD